MQKEKENPYRKKDVADCCAKANVGSYRKSGGFDCCANKKDGFVRCANKKDDVVHFAKYKTESLSEFGMEYQAKDDYEKWKQKGGAAVSGAEQRFEASACVMA